MRIVCFRYMHHAFPHDELLPLSCTGQDTLGGYWLTLIDALDALVVFGACDAFEHAGTFFFEKTTASFRQ
jgi:hypothetical protein